MKDMIEDKTRRQIAAALPDAIARALLSYEAFCECEMGQVYEKSKEFQDHHSACKAAIAHIELLIKLAHWADEVAEEDGAGAAALALSGILKSAQAEVGKYREES